MDIFELLAYIFIFTFLTEIVLSYSWFPFYFRSGLMVFRKEELYQPKNPTFKIDPELLDILHTKEFAHSLQFEKNSENEFFFRRKYSLWSLIHYPSIMHGRVTIDRRNNIVRVTGNMYWYFATLIIILIMAAFEANGSDSIYVYMFIALLILIIYLMHLTSFRKVFKNFKYLCEAEAYEEEEEDDIF